MNEVDVLTGDLCLEHGRDDYLRYGDFLEHFKMNEYFVKAITAPGSEFIKMLELPRELFLMKVKQPKKSVCFDVKPKIE